MEMFQELGFVKWKVISNLKKYKMTSKTKILCDFVLLFSSLCILIGCSNEPVSVIVNSDFIEKNNILIDGVKVRHDETAKRYQKILIKPGDHKVSINGGKEKQFNVSKMGGLLNLDEQEYVLMPIHYQTKESITTSSRPIPVIFDSLVALHKNLGTDQEKIIKFLSNKRFKGSAMYCGGEKYGKDELFINKKWHYGIDEEIPSEINEERPQGWELEVRTKLMEANLFFLLAKISEEYEIQIIKDEKLIELVEFYSN